MVCYNNFIILFGGIHDITHEKNDVYRFDSEKLVWQILEANSWGFIQSDVFLLCIGFLS